MGAIGREMNAAKKTSVVALLCFAFAPLTSGQVLRSANEKGRETRGVSVNDLQMSISHGAAAAHRGRGMQLVITFRNLGSREMRVLLGGGCGPKAVGKTSAVELNLTGLAGRVHMNLPFRGDGPPYQESCGGGMALFAVLLRPGASKSFQLDLGKYLDLSDSKEYKEVRFPAGIYLFQAELTLEAWHYSFWRSSGVKGWTGAITSNTLRVHFDKEFGCVI